MLETTVQPPTTQFSDSEPGERLDLPRESHGVSSEDTSFISSLGLLSIRIDSRKAVIFSYDADVMECRRANVLANRAYILQTTTNHD